MSNPQSRQAPRRVRRREPRMALLLLCVAIIALLVIFAPMQPTNRAYNVAADGTRNSAHQGLMISEVMADNTSAFPDEGGNFPDWLEIVNTADEPLDLEGLTLSDRPDRARFIFPSHVLQPGERAVVYCDGTNQNEIGKPYHAKFKISSITASVYLFDTTGYVLHSVENTPTLNANESYSMAEGGAFVRTDLYSPGFPNTQEGHRAYMAGYVMETGILVINEICPAPRSGLRDEDAELSDWVELKNNGSEVIDLSRYAMSDNEDRPAKWVFPEGSYIAPGGYFVVFASGKDRANPGGIPHANFSVAAEGEVLTLSTRQGQLLDRIAPDIVPADFSYGRDEEKSGWRQFAVPTPGAPNSAAGARLADRFMRSLNETGVYISEVISSNDTIQPVQGKPVSDWVELFNSTDGVVDISRWGLSDSVTWPRKWQFPQNTRIWPGEYKIVLLNDSEAAGTDAAALGANFALARAGGEIMTLSDATGRVLDRVVTPEIPTDISYGRGGGAAMEGFFYFDAPTPGRENGIGFTGFAPTPVLSSAGGLYAQDVTVTVTVPDGAEVRYTLDGSIPTIQNGTVYTEPLTFRDTAVLRARAFTGGLQPSEPVTATYVLKTYYSMPVVCLTADPFELWDPATGMLAVGEGIDILQYKKIPFDNPEPTYRLHGKEQRPGYAEMYDSQTGSILFSQGATFGLIGQYSLDMPQKSFKVTARAKYGGKFFMAPLFEDRPFDFYKSFVLRVSGNDAVWTRMVDGVQSRLVDQLNTTVIHQAWKPVIVYLNGQYWGHYNLRERVSRYFVAQHENVPMEQADNMTILEANGRSFWGSNSEYSDLIAEAKRLSPGTSPTDLAYLTDRIDVDNYFDYIILEAFFANTDTGNVRYYKLPGGKWKWILFDMDYGLFDSKSNGIRNILNPRGTGVGNAIDNTLIRKLLENEQMRDKFLRRFGEIFRQLTTDVMLRQIDECYALLKPEMMMHFERWASHNLKSISSDQPQTMDGSMRYWNERVDRLRNVVKKRPALCWDQVKEWFSLSDTQMQAYFGPRPIIPADAI